MNLPDRDEIVGWLIAAPPTVLLFACMGLAGWVWALEGNLADQSKATAVATAHVGAAIQGHQLISERLTRLEAKMDVLMETLIDMRATMRRIDKEHERLIP